MEFDFVGSGGGDNDDVDDGRGDDIGSLPSSARSAGGARRRVTLSKEAYGLPSQGGRKRLASSSSSSTQFSLQLAKQSATATAATTSASHRSEMASMRRRRKKRPPTETSEGTGREDSTVSLKSRNDRDVKEGEKGKEEHGDGEHGHEHEHNHDRGSVASSSGSISVASSRASSRSVGTKSSVTSTTTGRERVVIARGARSVAAASAASAFASSLSPSSGAIAANTTQSYRMVHDQCYYLCSTILSKKEKKKSLPISIIIEAAADLADLLSSRANRSVLWRGDQRVQLMSYSNSNNDTISNSSGRFGEEDLDADGFDTHHSQFSSAKNNRKTSSSPQIWKEILDVVAMLAQMSSTEIDSGSKYFETTGGSFATTFSSSVNNTNISTKVRTKSARRKERELRAATGGGKDDNDNNGNSRSNASVTSAQLSSSEAQLTRELKQITACIVYSLSLDCTLSEEQSLAVLGSVKSPSTARRVRLAILEHGPALSGIGKLLLIGKSFGKEPTPKQERQKQSFMTRRRPEKKLSDDKGIAQNLLNSKNRETASGDNAPTKSSSMKGDPTRIGRKNRKKRRLLRDTAEAQQAPESITTKSSSESLEFGFDSSLDILATPSSHETNFSSKIATLAPTAISGSQNSTGSLGSVSTSTLPAKIGKKLMRMRSKVRFDTAETEMVANKVFSNDESLDADLVVSWLQDGDDPWASLVCLESLKRIQLGQMVDGETCLVGSDGDGDGEHGMMGMEDDSTNPVLVANRLWGESGIIPYLGKAFSQSLLEVSKSLFDKADKGKVSDSSEQVGNEVELYYHERLSLSAFIVDGSCLECKQNRRGYCVEGPFVFDDNSNGIIFNVLSFLNRCYVSADVLSNKHVEMFMLLALRLITSLTHDNPLAVDQMSKCYESRYLSDKSGVQILLNLLFRLECLSQRTDQKSTEKSSVVVIDLSDHDMNRYDCSTFCLNTIANIIEGSGVRSTLQHTSVYGFEGQPARLLQWLCQWIVVRTESFRRDLLAIGESCKASSDPDTGPNSFSSSDNAKSNQSSNDNVSHFGPDEEAKLMAAGNVCVILALLTADPYNRRPGPTKSCRDFINYEISVGIKNDGNPSSTGVSLVINTLKAFRNFWKIKMGACTSIDDVEKLIKNLEDTETDFANQSVGNDDDDDDDDDDFDVKEL
mmetsp:Transcript_36940/g.89630  ORF Transcript_36940/g.89630 Transcript_36940/m.89630 type:complete len:1165 (+) Transcript_36940:158-3652(+)